MPPVRGRVRCRVGCPCGAVVGMDPPPWFKVELPDRLKYDDADARRTVEMLISWMPWDNSLTQESHPKPQNDGRHSLKKTAKRRTKQDKASA